MSLCYDYTDAAPTCASAYIWPAIREFISERNWPDRRAFDLGCGNGATANMVSRLGFAVSGVDTSQTGIAFANKAYPHINVRGGSAYDDLASIYGTFPLVVSLEVIEHCMDPRRFAKAAYDLLQPSGTALISTPYNGYLKNLLIALSGKYDRHHDPLWDGGHVKFFSINTLSQLLTEIGFKNITFLRVGRIPCLAKSMIAIAEK